MNTVVKPLLRVRIRDAENGHDSRRPDDATAPVSAEDIQYDLSGADYRVIMNCRNRHDRLIKNSLKEPSFEFPHINEQEEVKS